MNNSNTELKFNIKNTQDIASTEDVKKIEKSSIRSKKHLKSFVDTIDEVEIQKINLSLAKFFITANVKFENIESVHFMNFLKNIPAYNPPSFEQVSTSLLDEVQKIKKETISSQNVVFL